MRVWRYDNGTMNGGCRSGGCSERPCSLHRYTPQYPRTYSETGGIVLTLILGALTPEAIVLAGDGLCRKTEPDGRTWSQNDLQKIFPLRNLAIAIA